MVEDHQVKNLALPTNKFGPKIDTFLGLGVQHES